MSLSGDDWYPEDLDVSTALRRGSIVVVDTTQQPWHHQSGRHQCGAQAATLAFHNLGVRCSRERGHDGDHFVALRWNVTHVEAAERARKERAEQLRIQQQEIESESVRPRHDRP